MTTSPSPRPPLPPFDRDAAIQKVPRNRAEFLSGREATVQFLARKWVRDLDHRLIKEL